MKKVRVIALLLTLVLLSTCVLAGCTPATGAKRLVVNVGPNPDTIDPALNSAVDGATLIVHAFAGLMGWEQKDGKSSLKNDCAEKYEISADGLTYTFTLKKGLKWSNGEALNASDFIWSWNRAVDPITASDYEYMFDVIDGYDATAEGDANWTEEYLPKHKLNIVADDAKGTVTVKLKSRTPYFLELAAFPTYFPVYKKNVEASPDKWATKPETYIGNGPYKMIEWVLDSKIVYEKNELYHAADRIKTQEIEFALTDDDNAMLANFNNGTFKFIDSVPNDEIDRLKKDKADEFFISGQLGTYYYCWNINQDLSPAGKKLTQAEMAEVRQALSLLINRTNIVKIANAGQIEANSFVPIGLTQPDGSEFISTNGFNNDGKGYYSATDNAGNKTKAIEILSKYYTVADGKFTNFPTVNLLVNVGTGHEDLAVAIQSDFQAVGITLTIAKQEWQTFLNTRKQGDYSFARNGWLGDYNDPISFLDMWTTTSGNNDVQYGKGAHKDVAIYGENKDKTWSETFDKLIMAAKAENDPAKRFLLLHDAEDMLMETSCIVPLYFYTDIYMISKDLTGAFATPLGFKYFMYAEVK